MKNIKFILFIALTILISSCSNEDDELITNEYNKGLLKKTEHKDWTREIYYTDNKLIRKTRFISSETIDTYEAIYSDYKIVTINETRYFKNGSGNGYENIFDITYNNNEITLTQIPEDLFSETYIIETANGYVNSMKLYPYKDVDFYYETKFNRDSNNNIESIVLESIDDNNKTELYYTYSEFDNKVNLKPIHNPIFGDIYVALYKILNLKISKENPTKSLLYLDNKIFEPSSQTIDFEYDENKDVSKGVLNKPTYSINYNFEYY